MQIQHSVMIPMTGVVAKRLCLPAPKATATRDVHGDLGIKTFVP
jgi:hypothetical protein